MTNSYTVTELNEEIKDHLTDLYSDKITVNGEISGLKPSSGHQYFILKDNDSAINCIIWRSTAINMKTKVKNGDQVIIEGKLSAYIKTGSYQLYVNKIEMNGIGELYKKYELPDI